MQDAALSLVKGLTYIRVVLEFQLWKILNLKMFIF